ncbi:NAD-dependent epimerase/dehydratase family protein [Halalkalibacterium ligniniphilum]|uniref:NAD-dependent epimerase/dehydratase family protein n=1 Tax=Halalkalibacterium ligniniphilum TaxID=1134413 RepID=UPI00034BD9F4|nr:NAD-dependent epimerase/dehydratase family protein [Halalkalibacterium ligniniphilum]
MNVLVTGAAGFIGSSLCERLLEDPNVKIIGIDAYVGPTAKEYKKDNIQSLISHPRFQLIEQNLLNVEWEELLGNVDVIYHLAGMPGVRASWGADFKQYVSYNILVTQRLLEACKDRPLLKFIYASTSSIYGEKSGKVTEGQIPEPLSPYGITKLTGEYLCKVYLKNYSVPVVILRYFTVYGPRQRSDMAFHRFIQRMLENKPIPIFGDGKQTRDFTYIDDCVTATAAVLHAKNVVGEVMNIGGKERASVIDIISMLECFLEQKATLQFLDQAVGEPRHTWADSSKAEKLLAYKPVNDLKTGLKKEIDYVQKLYEKK